MKRFRLVNVILLVILFSLIVAAPVLAATYTYNLAFSVKDTGGTSRTYVPVLTGVGYSSLAAAGYATSATGTVVFSGTTQYSAMVGTTQTVVLVPSLPASNTQSLNLLTNYSVPWATQPIMTGYGGYYTTLDAAALEPGNNFEFERKGYFDTTKLGNLIIKTDAFRLWVPSSGNLAARIYANADMLSYTAGVTGSAFTGAVWCAQTFKATATTAVSRVYIYGTESGAVAGNTLTLSLRATAAGLPTGADLVSVTKTGATWDGEGGTHIFDLFYPITNNTTYALVLRIDGGANTPYWVYDGADPYADGQSCTSADSGATWAAFGGGGRDFNFKVQTSPYVTGACASGLRTIRVYSDGATFTLNVDGVNLGTSPTGAVPNNANNFIWGETVAANNPVIYDEYIKNDVGGVEVVWYQPNAVITGTAIPDRTGAAQDAAITWGANSNITVTIGGFTSYASVAGSSPATGTADTFQDANMPVGWFAVGTGGTLPFYDTFNTAATGLGISTQTLYIMMMMAVALAVGLMAGIMTGSWLIGTIGIGVMILAGVNTGVMPVWILFVYAVMGGGILYLSKQT